MMAHISLFRHGCWEEPSVWMFKSHWPSKSWPLDRCIKSLLVTYSTVCPHTTLHWTHSSWNICERGNNALMPIMVLRPVKERNGVCFRKVKVIQLFKNVLRRNCHKQYATQSYPLLQDCWGGVFSMSSDINKWMIKAIFGPEGLVSLVTSVLTQTKQFSAKPEQNCMLKSIQYLTAFTNLRLNLWTNTRNYTGP